MTSAKLQLDSAINAQIEMHTTDNHYSDCFSILVYNKKFKNPLFISMPLWCGNKKVRCLINNHISCYRM